MIRFQICSSQVLEDSLCLAFPGAAVPAKAGVTWDMGLSHGLGRSPEGGNGNSLQYSCLENSMDRGAWRAMSIGSQRVRHDWSHLACTHNNDVYSERELLFQWVSRKPNYLGNILAAIFKDEYSQKRLITLAPGFHLTLWGRGQQIFSIKGLIENTLDSGGQMTHYY